MFLFDIREFLILVLEQFFFLQLQLRLNGGFKPLRVIKFINMYYTIKISQRMVPTLGNVL